MLPGCLRAFPALSRGKGDGLRLVCISIRNSICDHLTPFNALTLYTRMALLVLVRTHF